MVILFFGRQLEIIYTRLKNNTPFFGLRTIIYNIYISINIFGFYALEYCNICDLRGGIQENGISMTALLKMATTCKGHSMPNRPKEYPNLTVTPSQVLLTKITKNIRFYTKFRSLS